MPGYRILKRKKNEMEYIMSEENKERYYRRILWLDAIVVIAFLLAIIILT